MAQRLHAREALRRVGGLELAALAGAVAEAVRLRLPVLLDGYAVTAAALAAVQLDAAAGEILDRRPPLSRAWTRRSSCRSWGWSRCSTCVYASARHPARCWRWR